MNFRRPRPEEPEINLIPFIDVLLVILIVSADATAAHQSVINVMDAARRAGIAKLTFATQSSAGAAR